MHTKDRRPSYKVDYELKYEVSNFFYGGLYGPYPLINSRFSPELLSFVPYCFQDTLRDGHVTSLPKEALPHAHLLNRMKRAKGSSIFLESYKAPIPQFLSCASVLRSRVLSFVLSTTQASSDPVLLCAGDYEADLLYHCGITSIHPDENIYGSTSHSYLIMSIVDEDILYSIVDLTEHICSHHSYVSLIGLIIVVSQQFVQTARDLQYLYSLAQTLPSMIHPRVLLLVFLPHNFLEATPCLPYRYEALYVHPPTSTQLLTVASYDLIYSIAESDIASRDSRLPLKFLATFEPRLKYASLLTKQLQAVFRDSFSRKRSLRWPRS